MLAAAPSLAGHQLPGARSGAKTRNQPATCLDQPIVKGCEDFHLMQLAPVAYR